MKHGLNSWIRKSRFSGSLMIYAKKFEPTEEKSPLTKGWSFSYTLPKIDLSYRHSVKLIFRLRIQ